MKLLLLLQKIATSNLAPWQKIDALKAFFFPSLSFAMRTAQIDKTTWHKGGLSCQERTQEPSSLPSNASNHYLYGGRKLAAVGSPSGSRLGLLPRLILAFKLLTSEDEECCPAGAGTAQPEQ
ncbi:retrovirus-related Pol polyprotein from type-1 retrotransposable element R2 [Trichonephila clavipes]|nr:retrovirus-related Pol polyprotein from type-1 retrotransposable element R2 [Trichonephila clavipes]